jgi:hypothetical protein
VAANNANIMVPGMARLYLAPVGTVAPIDATVALAATWRDVGYFTPDSLELTDNPDFNEVRSHQSNFPTRRFQVAETGSLNVDLQEWSSSNFIAVYGGGTITTIAGTPTQYKFTPPAIGGRTAVAAIAELIDGTKSYRVVVPNCQMTEAVRHQFNKTAASILPLRLAINGSDVAPPWYLYAAGDAAFAPVP